MKPIHLEIIELVKKGMSCKEIGAIVNLKPAIVRNRLAVIYKNYGVKNKPQLIVKLHNMGIQ